MISILRSANCRFATVSDAGTGRALELLKTAHVVCPSLNGETSREWNGVPSTKSDTILPHLFFGSA